MESAVASCLYKHLLQTSLQASRRTNNRCGHIGVWPSRLGHRAPSGIDHSSCCFVSANMRCPAIFAILANLFLQCQSPISSNAPSTPATALAPCRADYHRSMSKPATTIRRSPIAVVSVIVFCDHDVEPACCSLLFNITFCYPRAGVIYIMAYWYVLFWKGT